MSSKTRQNHQLEPGQRKKWRDRLFTALVVLGTVAAIWYMRHIDFPATDGMNELRQIAGYEFEARRAYYYRSRNFMDTWHLLRAEIPPTDLERYVAELALQEAGAVEYFDLIISRPPPYWWHPERIPSATLYEGWLRNERSITLMYSADAETAYLLLY